MGIWKYTVYSLNTIFKESSHMKIMVVKPQTNQWMEIFLFKFQGFSKKSLKPLKAFLWSKRNVYVWKHLKIKQCKLYITLNLTLVIMKLRVSVVFQNWDTMWKQTIIFLWCFSIWQEKGYLFKSEIIIKKHNSTEFNINLTSIY